MAFDYSKLRGRVVEKFGSQMSFAKAMGILERTLSLKMFGKRTWKQPEICLAINLLGLSNDDIQDYFLLRKFDKLNHISLQRKSQAEICEL